MKDKALRDAREEQQELEALHRLDEECVHQQRAGNYLKAFDCMERALVLRRHFFGLESNEVIQACRALAEMCNLLAMSFLQQDNYAVTIDLLKKAEVLTQRHHPVERATTLNNLACYYRRLGKLHSAMTSLKRALELEKKLENVCNAADTQLNMCAVLSQLGKHPEALEHAQEALITLQEGFIQGKHMTEASNDGSAAETSSSRLDRISVMCIAYHNVGVEQEFLEDYAGSVASYKKGIGLAEQYLGADHSITTTIRNSYLAAKRTLATKARVRPCSATRDQKSPGKTGARLLLSPRSGSLRMPSPLAKDRQSGSQIPTPRSIIADALSRAPLSALPPLEIQNPPSASKKKKTDAGKQKSAAPPLSPTDPFFSPRFRFDGGAPGPKVIKLVGITSPRSAAASSVEIQTPKSSNSKRERRKSSVKKPPTTADGGGRSQKSNADERTKSAPTPRQSEESFSLSIDEQNTMGGEAAVITSTLPTREIGAMDEGGEAAVITSTLPTREIGAMDEGGEAAAITSTLPTREIGAMDEGVEALRPNQDPNTLENVQGASAASSEIVDESEHTRPSSLEPEQHDRRTTSVVDSITVLHEQGHSLNFHPPGNFDDTEVNQAVDRNDLAKHELQRASTPQTEASVDKSKEGPVDIVLEAVYEAISLLLTRVINEVEEMNNIILDSDSVNNSVVPEEEVSDPVLHVELALLVEDSSDTTQLDEGPREFNEKVADHKDREEISSHYTQQETVKEEDTASLEALSMVASDDILELVHMEGPQKLEGDAIEDVASEAKLEFLGEDQVEVATATEVYVEDTPVDVKTLDTAAPFESAAIGNVEDVVQEAHPELTIESHPTAEGDTLDEQFHLLPVNFNNIDDAVLQNDIHDFETLGDTELAYSTPDMTEHGADLAESGQGVLPSDVDEQGDVHERGEFNILNVAEDLETTSVDHGSKEYYPDSAQYGDHGEPSASIEVEAELHDSGYEDIPHREIHTESQFPLASVDAYHSKPVTIDYEQPSYEDITVPRINEVEQEWNHSELATVESTADYNEYYQESSVAPHEEHLQYDAASGNYNDHAQETEVSPLLTDPPDFNQNPAEGCTDIPDPDTTE